MEDSEIIVNVLNGSIDEYALIIERYQQKLQSTLSFYCTNEHEVEYFLHETFVKAYTRLKKFNCDYPFFPWLKTIALNLIRDEIRSRKSLSEDAREFLLNQLSTDQISEHKLEILKNCIGELESSQQEILKLRYWAKNGIDELAQKLSRKPSALKMQLLRIRESLKRCMKLKAGVSNG